MSVGSSSSDMILSFTQPYYAKRLLNGSAEVTAYLEYASGEPSGCWMDSEDAVKPYQAVVR